MIADGRYTIESLLGEGGMGRVYRATQRLGAVTRKVAVKVLHPEARRTPGLVDRLQREVALAIQLDHPNIVRVYDSGALPGGALFVAMEYVEGESLSQAIAAGRLPAARAEVVVRQVASALAQAHEHGIVHRDLKPDNVLLTRRGGRGDVVKVVDFGIARQVSAEGGAFTRAGLILGTPAYMAPEQFAQSDVTAAADLYALGVLTYEMLTGALPYQASTPWEWALAHGTGTPRPLIAHGPVEGLLPRHHDAVMRALGRTPGERFASVIEFAQAFTGDPGAGAGWTEGFSSGHGSSPAPFGVIAPVSTPPAPPASLPPTTMSTAYAPTLQPFGALPTHQGGAPPAVPARPTRTAFRVVLAALLVALAAVAVAVVEWWDHHHHDHHPEEQRADPPVAPHAAPHAKPPAGGQAPAAVPGVDAVAPRPADVAAEAFSVAHRYWTPGTGELPESRLTAEVAPAVERRDGRCVSIPPGAVVTLLLSEGRALGRRAGADLRISLVGDAASGAYNVELGPDHDHLRGASTGLRGDAELDVDPLGFGPPERPTPLRCVRVSVPAGGAGVCLDAVETLQVAARP